MKTEGTILKETFLRQKELKMMLSLNFRAKNKHYYILCSASTISDILALKFKCFRSPRKMPHFQPCRCMKIEPFFRFLLLSIHPLTFQSWFVHA